MSQVEPERDNQERPKRDNMKKRVVCGLALGLGSVAALAYLPTAGLLAVLVAASSMAQWEAYRAMEKSNVTVFKIVGLLCGAMLVAASFLYLWITGESAGFGHEIDSLVLAFSVVAVLLRQLPQKFNRTPLLTVAFTLFGIMYVPFLLNYLCKIAFIGGAPERWAGIGRDGRLAVFYVVLVAKGADMGAYFVGSRFGRHRMFERLSPGKTWEGFAGGAAAAVTLSLTFKAVFPQGSPLFMMGWGDALMLGLLLTVAGLVGDFSGSLLKRSGGVKDSGTALPGMGGVLDVLDSLLLCGPAFYLYARLFMQ